MKIIEERERHHVVNYALEFVDKDDELSGFSFPCDKDGKVLLDKLFPEGLENYRKCVSGEHKVETPYVRKYEHTYISPAVGLCDCGQEVLLQGFTNVCDECEESYNSSGQRLAHSSQWEDTY